MRYRFTVTDKVTGRQLDSRRLSGETDEFVRMRCADVLIRYALAHGYDPTNLRGDLTELAPTPTAIPGAFIAAFAD